LYVSDVPSGSARGGRGRRFGSHDDTSSGLVGDGGRADGDDAARRDEASFPAIAFGDGVEFQIASAGFVNQQPMGWIKCARKCGSPLVEGRREPRERRGIVDESINQSIIYYKE
jgi:hypothetical protein